MDSGLLEVVEIITEKKLKKVFGSDKRALLFISG